MVDQWFLNTDRETILYLAPLDPDPSRTNVTFACPNGHEFARIFAAGIDLPTAWDCPHCGRLGQTDSGPFENSSQPTGKTHWDMVLERRSQEDLASMLADSVKDLRAR
ncbi:MAG: RNA polymerase-binding protein RbpA [Propionibacteriaceae bacterium]|jgi:hypothetical protein|nr:RNA polymerase-binding protein RbpA [Propionibacteriaceae bacterium]